MLSQIASTARSRSNPLAAREFHRQERESWTQFAPANARRQPTVVPRRPPPKWAGSCPNESSRSVLPLAELRVSDHRERQDRAIVNTQIGIVNAKIGHGEHLDRAS